MVSCDGVSFGMGESTMFCVNNLYKLSQKGGSGGNSVVAFWGHHRMAWVTRGLKHHLHPLWPGCSELCPIWLLAFPGSTTSLGTVFQCLTIILHHCLIKLNSVILLSWTMVWPVLQCVSNFNSLDPPAFQLVLISLKCLNTGAENVWILPFPL